ncbi:MAG TPA: Tn3 family transposase, partial [Solirubrobacteraceae bacterium]
MAREFGFRRGVLNLVNWVSDQYSQYGTKVVSVAEREAIHTLEAILHTQLPILEHMTDTHGAILMWTVGRAGAVAGHLVAGRVRSPGGATIPSGGRSTMGGSAIRGSPRCGCVAVAG